MANTKYATLGEIKKVTYFPILKIRQKIFKGLLFHLNGAMYVNTNFERYLQGEWEGGFIFLYQ
jgi:hypothetical protein